MALPTGNFGLPALNQPPVQLPQLIYGIPPAQAQIAGRSPYIQNAALASVLGPLTQPNYGIPVVSPYGSSGFGQHPIGGYTPPIPGAPSGPAPSGSNSGGLLSGIGGLVGSIPNTGIFGTGGIPPVVGMPTQGGDGPVMRIPRDPGMSTDTPTQSNLAGLAGGAQGALNLYNGIEQGGQQGAAQALLGAGKLAGAIGSSGATAGTALGSALASSGAATALPIAGAAFLGADYLNKAFLGDSSKGRNIDAYKQATGAQQVTLPMGKMGANYFSVPDGQGGYQLVSAQQFNDLAGSWYGATYAPDGNQGDWQQKYQGFMQGLTQPKLPNGYSWDPSTGKIMYRDKVAGNYGG